MLYASFLVLPLLAYLVNAQWSDDWWGHDHEPPQVASLIHSMQSVYSPWTGYHGPTGYPTAPYPRPTSTSTASAPGATNTCAYWLENIKHQGIAAFNSPSYQVFRNVKDFGAKGGPSSATTREKRENETDFSRSCR